MVKVCVLGSKQFAEQLQEEGKTGGDVSLEYVQSPDRAKSLLAQGACEALLVSWQLAWDEKLEIISSLIEAAPGPVLVVAEPPKPELTVDLLKAGANEVVPAALSAREIISHLRALLRRHEASQAEPETPPVLRVGRVTLDLGSYQASQGDEPLNLTPREFALLAYLMEHAGQACRREELAEQVWGGELPPNSRTLDVHIGRLRSKLDQEAENAVRIVTLPGVGYRLEAD